jgi:hypothetical protein
MKILSIDVGIKNLAFCLFENNNDIDNINNNNFKIKKWDIINISEEESFKCGFLDSKKKVLCNKPAKFKKNFECFCLKHSKKQNFQIPTKELKSNYINKQKIQSLYEIADKYQLKYDKPIKKQNIITLINEYIHNSCFEEILTTNSSKIDLINIGINIKNKFDHIFSEEYEIDYVIIENQISPIANRMKTIQGMIAQYFIMSNVIVNKIEFVSAVNKLKNVDLNKKVEKSDKTTYNERKKLGISKCLDIISNDERFNDKIEFFKSHNKKDDLSDSFLQGIWYISTIFPLNV